MNTEQMTRPNTGEAEAQATHAGGSPSYVTLLTEHGHMHFTGAHASLLNAAAQQLSTDPVNPRSPVDSWEVVVADAGRNGTCALVHQGIAVLSTSSLDKAQLEGIARRLSALDRLMGPMLEALAPLGVGQSSFERWQGDVRTAMAPVLTAQGG